MLYDKQYKMEAALKMYKDCLPIYKEMHAKEEVEIQEKIGKLTKELFDSTTSWFFYSDSIVCIKR